MPRGKVVTFATAVHWLRPAYKAGFVGTAVLFLLTFVVQRVYLRWYGWSIRSVCTSDDAKVSPSLMRYLRQIGRIALPTWHCREAAGSMAFILLFAVKALLRVWVSRANGAVLATMLHGRPASRIYRFIQAILARGAIGLAAAMCSGAIEGIRPWLIGCYRERLSRVFQRRFYQRLVYYQATALDNRLEAADTVIATYCGEFAEHFAELPYYFVLPGFECITSTYALVQQTGLRSASIMSAIVAVSVLLLRKLALPFGRIHSLLLSREDDYRRMLTNDLSSVESIAMHDAGQFTRRRLDASLKKLKFSLDHMALAKGNFEMLEVAFSTFLSLVAYSVTFITTRDAHFKRPVNDIYLEIQLIEDLNSSVKDFVVNFLEISHLSEFTTKLAEFDTTLESIAAGTFVNNSHSLSAMVSVGGKSSGSSSSTMTSPALSSNTRGSPIRYTEVKYSSHIGKTGTAYDLAKMEGVVLRSPVGQLLFSDMNISIKSDEDWVIIGENGCGKTSLLRMLCGLWLPSEGRLTLDKSLVFLLAPQHSYMASQCTLLEQVCFPQTAPEVTDRIREQLKRAIDLAGAQTVIEVIGGYDSQVMGFDAANVDEGYDWTSLSGGQKQRISMARVFFHVLRMDRTKHTPVAILDEATSMMDDTEQDVLNNLRRLNVRMLSVTHREVVIRHHANILKINKGGAWKTEKVRNPVPVGTRVEDSNVTV